jgi:hypothetical protein
VFILFSLFFFPFYKINQPHPSYLHPSFSTMSSFSAPMIMQPTNTPPADPTRALKVTQQEANVMSRVRSVIIHQLASIGNGSQVLSPPVLASALATVMGLSFLPVRYSFITQIAPEKLLKEIALVARTDQQLRQALEQISGLPFCASPDCNGEFGAARASHSTGKRSSNGADLQSADQFKRLRSNDQEDQGDDEEDAGSESDDNETVAGQ